MFEIWVCGHCREYDEVRAGRVYPVVSDGGPYPECGFRLDEQSQLRTTVVVAPEYGRICRTCQDLAEVEQWLNERKHREYPRGEE